MAKMIAHIFPDLKSLYAHLKERWDEQEVLEINKTGKSYTMRDGTIHKCFAVRSRDDANDWLAFMFHDARLHGSFAHLGTNDYQYMASMLNSRIRPEVAA
jgi:hypothetical protein